MAKVPAPTGATFSWRNVLGPTPANIYWFFTTLEALAVAFNAERIASHAPVWVVYTLMAIQIILGKMVHFFGKVKEEAEKQTTITVTSGPDSEVTVTKDEIIKDDQ